MAQSVNKLLTYLQSKKGQSTASFMGTRATPKAGAMPANFKTTSPTDTSLYDLKPSAEPHLIDSLPQDLGVLRSLLMHRERAATVFNMRKANSSYAFFEDPMAPATWASVLTFGSKFEYSEPFLTDAEDMLTFERRLRVAADALDRAGFYPPDLDLGPKSPEASLVKAILDEQKLFGGSCDCEFCRRTTCDATSHFASFRSGSDSCRCASSFQILQVYLTTRAQRPPSLSLTRPSLPSLPR